MKRPFSTRFVCMLLLLNATACGQSAGLVDKPPFLAPSTDIIDFGNVEVGDSLDRTLFLINKGDKVLTLGEPVGDTLGGVFTVVVAANAVAPNAEADVTITFAPSAETDYNVAFTFPNDSDNEPSFVITLKGIGIAPNPCKGVSCTTPPAPACLGSSSSRVYDPEGQCNDGDCDYTQFIESCEFGCDTASGLCKGNPCIGVTCNTPPAPTCLGTSTSQVYNAIGQCSLGTCSYAIVPETCEFGCDAATGLCKADPCTGVTCNTPPSACYQTIGTCNGGNCVYPPAVDVVCDDSNPCSLGDSCFEGSCRGTPKLCNDPPAPVCTGTNARRVWASQGTCQTGTGECSYTPSDLNCAFGCNATTGNCNGDPCQGVVCNTPPNGCYQSTGTCGDGACSYAFNNGAGCTDSNPCTLSDACSQGVCVGSPKACVTPPSNTCIDANHVRQYTTLGSCNTGNGNCDYTYTDVTCQYGCTNNACNNEPNYGSDAVDIRLSHQRSGIVDVRDIDLVYTNPVGGKCNYNLQAPAWGNYASATWSATPDPYNQETIVHVSPKGNQADGTYRISASAYSLCAELICYGQYCVCTNTEPCDTTVEIRVNNVLKMTCTYKFLDSDGAATTIDYATITRTNGFYSNPVASGASGVTCTAN